MEEVLGLDKLKATVIDGGYCIGCGACASTNPSISMKLDKYGRFQAFIESHSVDSEEKFSPQSICPFSDESLNEDQIGARLFEKHGKHDEKIGYHLATYAGFVYEDELRTRGSSGGFGTWIAILLLREGLVDAVIHVRQSNSNSREDLLFEYSVSSNFEEVKSGAKSRYYPVEMSKVLQTIREREARYVVVGIPCFIKAVRLLMFQDSVMAERVKFCIGLVCGHLKSTAFAESLAWFNGIDPENVISIDFRKKDHRSYANDYAVEITGFKDSQIVTVAQPIRNCSYLTDWGVGLFKYKACDFCDDVVAETADISIGDAWLPKYIKESYGTNIIVVRNPLLNQLIQHASADGKIHIENISSEEVVQSQAGGFRHRREGLAYRLYLEEQEGNWHPRKRVMAKSSHLKSLEKRRFYLRSLIAKESHVAFRKAKILGNFSSFEEDISPKINEYYGTYLSKVRRFTKYIKSIVDNLFK